MLLCFIFYDRTCITSKNSAENDTFSPGLLIIYTVFYDLKIIYIYITYTCDGIVIS